MPAQKNMVLKPASVRHNNYRSILLTIRSMGICTVADIAKELNLSKTAIFKAILRLTELGFVISAGKGSSTASGGKPPEKYSINPNCRYTCSISFYHDVIMVYIHNFIGELVHQTAFPTPDAYMNNTDEVLTFSYKWITQTLSFCHVEPRLLCGVIFLYDSDPMRQDLANLYFKSKERTAELGRRLSEKLGIPDVIYVRSPKDMRGYAELQSDESRREKLVVVVSVLKEEVTGCILHHGAILEGAGSSAANFAHVPTDLSMEHLCTCGRRGCFATVALKSYILKRLSKELKAGTPTMLQEPYQAHSLNMVNVVHAAEAGDEVANRHMDHVLENYTTLIYIIYLTLNPDEVILQVGPNGKDYHERELNKRFREINLPSHDRTEVLKISTSPIEPYKATAIGAANYCVDNYLNNPICFDG